MNDGEDAGFFQADAAQFFAGAQQPAPPAGIGVKLLNRRGKARHHRIVVGGKCHQGVAHRGQQRRIASDGVGVQENRQIHQAIGAGQQQPLAHALAKLSHRAAPQRVVQHDVAGALWVAKAGQHVGKALANGLQIGRRRVVVAQQQAVVLVGFEQLLAAPFAAHDEQTAVGQQIGRRHYRPSAFKQAHVELLHQRRHQPDARAAPVQRSNQPGNLHRRLCQVVQIARPLNLHRDQVRVVGQEAKQVQRFQNTQHLVAINHHQAVYALAQQQRHGVAQLVGGAHGDHRAAGQIAHRQSVQRAAIQNGALQRGVGKNAQLAIGHSGDQHAGGVLLLKHPHYRDDVGAGIDHVRWAQISLIHPRQRQRLAFVAVAALRQRAEFFAQV